MKFYLLASVFLPAIATIYSAAVDVDLSITLDQKRILDKFREQVSPSLTHDYMHKDIYLIRWLRARNFDLYAAERMLYKNLEWREENRMDTILDEDFSDMSEDYKYYIEGTDVEGKPVAFFDLGSYDLRKAGVTGKIPRLLRYMFRYLEEITTKVRMLQEEGKSVTQYSFIVNMDGFNAIQHLCLQCLPMVLNFINSYESHYPGSCNEMFLVNTPTAFEAVLNAIKNAAGPATRKALQVYGTNKSRWQAAVYKNIPRDQLPRSVGGTADYTD